MNYYIYDQNKSKEQAKLTGSLRKIYKIEKNGKIQFLSIDFEKCCCFEVHDANGKHICEIRFDGIENGKNTKDTTGRHDFRKK